MKKAAIYTGLLTPQNKKKPIFFLLYFLFFLLLVYALNDFQTSQNTGVIAGNRIKVHITLFFITVFLGAYYAIINSASIIRKTIIINFPINLPLLGIAGWVVIINLSRSADYWSAATEAGLSILWLLVYFFFGSYLRRRPNSWPTIQICITIMFFFYFLSTIYAVYFIQKLYDRVAVVNLVYHVLVFLPWISLMTGKWIRWVCVLIVLVAVVISMKRGAVIAFPLMLGTSLLVEATIRKKGVSLVFLKILFAMGGIFAALLLANQLSHGYLSERFSYEQLVEGSGRSELLMLSIDELAQRSSLDILLGLGSGYNHQYLEGKGAHNEWLEFLSSFGVIGFMLYAWLVLALVRKVVQLIKRSSPYASAYAMAVVYILFVGMIGQIYFTHSTLFVMAFLGTVEGLMFNDARKATTNSKIYKTSKSVSSISNVASSLLNDFNITQKN